MSAETTQILSVSEAELREDSQCNQSAAVLSLRQILDSCSKSMDSGDVSQSGSSVMELVKFLDSVFEAAESEPDDEEAKSKAFQVLSEIHQFTCDPKLDQAVIDALSFELPTAVAKLAGFSSRCLDISNEIIDRFIAACGPRDMLSILCEALDSLCKMIRTTDCYIPLLRGLSKVFLSIQRRHFEQLKSAIPVIVKVLKAVSSESYDEDTNFKDLYDKCLDIAQSMHAVCIKLEGGAKEKLYALLGLYVLQIMTFVSVNIQEKESDLLPLVSQFSRFLPQCGLSYLCLLTGSDVDKVTSIIVGEDDDNYIKSLADIKLGASVSVIWGHISHEVVQAAKEDLTTVTAELRNNQPKRWLALGTMKHVLLSVKLPWEFKKHAMEFLLSFMDGDVSRNADNTDFSSSIPSVFAALKAVEMIIMYTSDTTLRKNAFLALKKILDDIPSSQRLDMLKALITNSNSPSMIAILIDIVRAEMCNEISQRKSQGNNRIIEAGNVSGHTAYFWSPSVLDLVELVLRPQKGGPPALPEDSDAVISALNLLRYILITESTGKTNFTGILSEENLRKAYDEWLMPLRTLVTGIATVNRNDTDEYCVDTACALNPVELVLFRCIELVEEKLKHSP